MGEFLGGVAVAVILSPVVHYLFTRRAAQAEAAYGSRVGIYAEMYEALARYREHVKWMSPNRRGPAGAFPSVDPDSPIWTEALELSMRLHASTTIRAQIKELLAALDESKGQSWHYDRETQFAGSLPRGSFDQEWAYWRSRQHARRKAENDKWADECLTRIKDRMRFELYGWMPVDNVISRRRVKPIAARIAEKRTDFFTGGVDASKPPPELRAEFDARKKRQSGDDERPPSG